MRERADDYYGLARQVIQAALYDITRHPTGGAEAANRMVYGHINNGVYRDLYEGAEGYAHPGEAVAWVMDTWDSMDEGTFGWWCYIGGIDPLWARDRVRAHIEQRG